MGRFFEVSPEHVQRSAAGMIAAHGSQAGNVCQAQIDKMRRRNDAAGERLWCSVLEHIQSGNVTRLA
jgi:hypothetical protein